MITQDTIAEHLGLSRITVARALTGGRISSKNRELVENAARELGYNTHTNRAARELAARRYGTQLKNDVIAVFLPKSSIEPLRSGAFFSPFLDGIELQAEKMGLDVFIHSPRENYLPRIVQNRGVDGVICLAVDWDVLPQVKALLMPVVTLSTLHNGAHGLAPDDYKGAHLVTQHLIDSGHERIAYLGHLPDFSPSVKRLQGYKDALSANGLVVEESLIEATLWSPHQGDEGLERLLNRAKFSALVCHNDLIAMGAIRELEKCGLRVPQDVSVTGFDDLSLQMHFTPTITSIAFDREAMGRRAVELLQEVTESKSCRHETIPVELIVRDSTRQLDCDES